MARPAYCFTVAIQRPLHAALVDVRAALQAEGFQVVAECEAPAEGRCHQVLFTHVGLQARIINAEPNTASMLPWTAAVLELAPQHTHVALQDPMLLTGYTRNAQVKTACEQAALLLRRVSDRLMLGRPVQL